MDYTPQEVADDHVIVTAGAEAVCSHCASYTGCKVDPVRISSGVWVHPKDDPESDLVAICYATRVREAVYQLSRGRGAQAEGGA